MNLITKKRSRCGIDKWMYSLFKTKLTRTDSGGGGGGGGIVVVVVVVVV